MSVIKDQFLKDAESKGFDKKHRKTIRFNIDQYDQKVVSGKMQFADLEKARKLAKNIKWQTMEKLDRYLLEFEQRFTENGGKVIWAQTAEEAANAVVEIAKARQARMVVKSKSMVTEEIHLNKALENANIGVLETDLGEYIVQLEDSRPYHIITPIMHKSKEDVSALFHEKFNTPMGASPAYIANFVREKLREEYTTAEIGVTGGNFLLADTGGVVLTENEGNARLCAAYPKTHIAIVGIEKVIPSYEHLELFLPLLSTFGTGQELTVYNTVYHGPKRHDEVDGPEEMYVILLDNGRSKILADPRQRESLYCIRCGACLNACPVYKTIGGHAYGSTYSGPIGKVISPNLESKEKYGHLSNASSLCGACTKACPVNINLHELILLNRKDETDKGLKPKDETKVWAVWRRVMLSRWMMNVPFSWKNFALQYFFKSTWGDRRELPVVASRSFNKMWKDGEV